MKNAIRVLVKIEAEAEGLPLPAYQTTGSSGVDLHAAIKTPVVLLPGETKLISAGISVSIPDGYEGQVRPRSGLALKHGITLPNAPGTIDSDYRGIISVIMTNAGRETFTVERGMRIAQLVFAPVTRAELEVVPELDETTRAGQGFGHTGHGIKR